jgi:lysophospholipase L1-like esterase
LFILGGERALQSIRCSFGVVNDERRFELCGELFALAVKRDKKLVKRAIGVNLRISGQTTGRLGVGDLRRSDRRVEKLRGLTLDRQTERNLAKLLHVLVDVGVAC